FLVSAFAIVVRAMGFFYDEFNRFDTAGVLAGLHRQSRGMGVTESRMMIRFCGCHILGMHPFVKAMLAHFIVPPEEVGPKLLAQMDIWDGEKRVEVEFLCCNDNFLRYLPEFEFCSKIFTINNNGLWGELYDREYILDIRGASGTDEDKYFNKFLTEFKQKTL
ncbi:MAG: hypothetical protein SVR94_19480, partial [Pseudomonadota bacterium]|nr:hypothetical protein [Pseudomonadota bacterium]